MNIHGTVNAIVYRSDVSAPLFHVVWVCKVKGSLLLCASVYRGIGRSVTGKRHYSQLLDTCCFITLIKIIFFCVSYSCGGKQGPFYEGISYCDVFTFSACQMLLKVMKYLSFITKFDALRSYVIFERIITVCRVLLDSWRFASIISWSLSNSGRLCFELLTPYFIRSVNFAAQIRANDRIRTLQNCWKSHQSPHLKCKKSLCWFKQKKKEKEEVHVRKEQLQTGFGGQFSCDSSRQVNKHRHCSLWKASKTLTLTSEFNMGILLCETSVHLVLSQEKKSHVSNVSTRVSADLPASPAR